MPSVSLTCKIVDSLPPPVACKSVDYFDQRMPGLVLRVSAGGTKSWNAIYRHQGRARRLTLGRYPIIELDDARDRAREALCQVSRGTDPAQRKPEGTTCAELASMFITQHVSKLRRAHQVGRLIERELVPAWRHRAASSITRRDIALLVDAVAARAPVLANRVLATVRRLFTWAVAQGLLDTNPCDGVERPSREHARERVLTASELQTIWHSDPQWAPLFRLSLLTAQRVGEVLGMRWNQIEGDWWTVSSTKNGRSHRVPLCPQALQELSRLRRRGDYVFAAPRAPEAHLRGYRKAFKRLRIPNARVHDLRRTAASMIASVGVNRTVLGQILNHADRSVTSVYDRYSYDAEKRAALAILAEKIMLLVERGEPICPAQAIAD